MKSYLVIKRVNLEVGSKTYRKDAIITAEMVGKEKIKFYLTRGYIKEIGVGPVTGIHEGSELPFYLTAENYLTPKEVNTLERSDLMKYAEHIGVGFKGNIPTKRLQTLVNQFIEIAETEDAEDEDDADSEDSDTDNTEAAVKDGEENA